MTEPQPRSEQYEQWVREFAPELYRFAYRLTGRREKAEDLLQETFVEAWKSLNRQRDPGRARAWLFQILRFRFAHLVRDERHDRLACEDQPLADRPETQAVAPLQRLADEEGLQKALGTLTPDLRQTFLLVFAAGHTCREAAEALQIPLGTVLSRLDRARQLLRVQLGDTPKRTSSVANKESLAP
jgi:RNA polymerase sigma-70 factor (ECF subfamily)